MRERCSPAVLRAIDAAQSKEESGAGTELTAVALLRAMIEEEDGHHPLTDEQITERLQGEGIQVTRRTVAKYREDMKIPSTHQRRVRN